MKNELTCEIVQDLLPSYVDHLTNDVTNAAISAHLADCKDCSQILSDMQAPEPPQTGPDEDAPTIDFLRKNRRKNQKRILAAVLIVALLLSGLWGWKTYIYPAPVTSSMIQYNITVKDDKTVQIKGSFANRTQGISKLAYSYDKDKKAVTVNIKTRHASFFSKNAFFEKIDVPGEIHQVYVNDRIAWEDGTPILPETAEIYATIHPYVGDTSENGKTLTALGIQEVLPISTQELQTTTEPYGWTLHLDGTFKKSQQTQLEATMKNYAMALLVCTKNLGSVTFSYDLDGTSTEYTYTAEEGKKDFHYHALSYYRDSAVYFQGLLAQLGIINGPVFSSKGEDGYRLTEMVEKIPDAEITGTIRDEKQTIIKQFESHLVTNSWLPGSISKSFSSEKDALSYIGYKHLLPFSLPQKADSISVNASGDKYGNLCYISLAETYSLEDKQINVTAAADLYTENSSIDSYVDIDYSSFEETQNATSTGEYYTTASGDIWQIVTVTSGTGDFYDYMDAYMDKNKIQYAVHIGYPNSLKEKAQAEMKKILENGIGKN